MKPIVITAGEPFTDIDALSCAIGYQDLLRLEGKTALAVLPGPLNQSVTASIKAWGLDFATMPPKGEIDVVLVDISNPDYIASFANPENVMEIYDHHMGYEQFWSSKIGKSAKIEFVGAAATLVWEEWVARGFANQIIPKTANLLYTGIVSNTLNFKASITTARDHRAIKELSHYTDLPDDWIAEYYREQERSILSDIVAATSDDTKVETIPNLGLTITIGQLELWEGSALVGDYLDLAVDAVREKAKGGDWFITSPSISEGKNYLYVPTEKLRVLLRETIQANFDGEIGSTQKLWMRKEILRALQSLKRVSD